ncbi:MAG: phosphodiester glycosidase family protein [Ferruginibacter sp.]
MQKAGQFLKQSTLNKKNILLAAITLLLIAAALFIFSKRLTKDNDDRFVTFIADCKKQNIKLYWKDTSNENFRSIQNLKLWLNKNNQQLLFAMNAGMYKPDNSPQGLYIENEKILSALDTANGNGNFYLKPNGIFYITADNVPFVCTTSNFLANPQIKYATQSGPMLVINGQIHPAFTKASANLNIRNGVGILPGNKIVFAMSKTAISFYDFADYFKMLGCKNALYLDGLVSHAYLPEQNWIQTDGNFGVMIGVTEK